MISEPAYVPTDVELSDEASRPMEKIVPITGPSTCVIARCAPSMESVPDMPCSELAASTSIARFTVPASNSAQATSIFEPFSCVLIDGFSPPA